MGYRRVIEWNGVEEVRMGWEAVIAVAGVAVSAASTIYSATRPKPKSPLAMPTRDDPKIREAAEMEAKSLKAKKGMASTMLTGPEGMTTLPTTLKTELGA